ncbi:exodeoxyribonuclease III [Aureibaculum sp. A20]|uniref:Exodeoxyribonuclease III n=1 Tax=Aureibaculum flavum TaxID=2795986 RepID=A0ABS0WUM6_9FLAO|nr:exodeoxyribonuclease III [Aureibaculum flavum]MBJ2175679.1 exodeoxyribonuclease III [Aureibaculum flavum]
MHIISWNVNGIRAIVKKNFVESVKKMNPDIICLQETRGSDQEVEKTLLPFKDYNKFFNAADKRGYSGTTILSKPTPEFLKNNMNIAEHDVEGRIQCASYPNFFLINVYVPNSGQQLDRLAYRKKWDADFLSYLKELEKTKPVIVCGDFNVAHQSIDLKNDKSNYNKTAGYTQVEIDGMDNYIKSGFIDTFRYFHPNEVAYTFWSYRFKARERNTGWRIDYFLVSKSLLPRVKSVSIYSHIMGSDHCPIGLEIE